jgi:hypothetical protein
VNAIGNAGSREWMLGAFEKVGLYPFMRNCLQDENVHHEIIVNVVGDADNAANPKASF